MPNLFLKNPHLSTIYSVYLKKAPFINYKREKLETWDQDFLSLDWSKVGSSGLVILSHGLEGSSQSTYIKKMATFLNDKGLDCLAWNFRSCCGEKDYSHKFYHAGKYDDLEYIVEHVSKSYDELYLIGFSLGGNLNLKYLANSKKISKKLKASVQISTPFDLYETSLKISKGLKNIYGKNFLKTMKLKAKSREKFFQNINLKKALRSKNLIEFDEYFTAPVYGFSSAIDYYNKASFKEDIFNIKTPSLIINALDDPFLGEVSYPVAKLESHKFLSLKTPKYGGHVSFEENFKESAYYCEKLALDFILKEKKI